MRNRAARHLSEEGARFLDLVFAMHDPAELRDLFGDAGFREIRVTSAPKVLTVPPPEEFLWQYIHSTPLAAIATSARPSARQALQDEVCPEWSDHVTGGKLGFEVGMTTVQARA